MREDLLSITARWRTTAARLREKDPESQSAFVLGLCADEIEQWVQDAIRYYESEPPMVAEKGVA